MPSSTAKIIPLASAQSDRNAASTSLLKRFKMSLFPSVKDIYVMVNKQCVLLEELIAHLDSFLKDNSVMEVNKIMRLEQQRDDLKLGSISELTRSFANPMRDDIHRAVYSIDTAIDFVKNTVQEMQLLEITTDDHIVGMVDILQKGTTLLRAGLDQLETDPQKAVEYFEEMRAMKRSIDKLYRLAIAELFSADAEIHALRARDEDAKPRAFERVVEIFKRREIYRHIFAAGDQMALVGGALRNLVGHGL